MRLDRYLAECGIGSRSEVKRYIKNGRVAINSVVADRADIKVNETSDCVSFDGKRLVYKKFIYLMLNKPQGFVSAVYDAKLPTVADLIDKKYSHFDLFPVGRLDIDTTGLLFLTNDGITAHKLTSPKHHASKVYRAMVEGKVEDSDVDKFFNGIVLDDGYKCKSAHLVILKSDNISEIELTIYEGKFHQVKRMFESVGKKVIDLKRIAMGGVWLDTNLAEGQMRELSASEEKILKGEESTENIKTEE